MEEICGQDFMAGTICTDAPNHDGGHSAKCQRCGGDWINETCTCPSWVVVERFGHRLESGEYDNEPLPDQAFGPYPGMVAARKAMEDSLLIEDACGDTKNPYQVTDCYFVREDQLAADAERIIVDLTDPHHTGEEE